MEKGSKELQKEGRGKARVREQSVEQRRKERRGCFRLAGPESRAPDRLPNCRRLGPARVARQLVNSAAPSRLSCAGAGTGLGRFSWAVWQEVSQDKGRAS